ncbi:MULTISPECIES: creatininase family protein [unclassified Bradyrhizobium]|uniref:creatininase family protein n=1 Tax=unclassified Bradyrhizobium TaxID=2631580 RepID=UPI00040408CD|nr:MULTISPECIES: creatininase family protein [unclassified Bradyrhizobium]QIG93737.1 creatininase family protein [Bradyrhizobium sp. 6(2017)]
MSAEIINHFIERLTWDEVARRIAAGRPAILPIGAAAKQHGFHLPLNTDRVQAEWFAAHLAERIDALIWPTLTYGHYPAFINYAGSASLSAATFEAMVHEIAAGILDNGISTLFVLNTGVSTLAPVERALAGFEPAKVTHLRLYQGPRFRRTAEQISEQRHGSHADELETSLMLALAPDVVDPERAEASPALRYEVPGRLTPSDSNSPNYSRSGSYGDPTLATSAKGAALLAAILDDLSDQVTAALGENDRPQPRGTPR